MFHSSNQSIHTDPKHPATTNIHSGTHNTAIRQLIITKIRYIHHISGKLLRFFYFKRSTDCIFLVTGGLPNLFQFGYNIVPMSSLDHGNIGLIRPQDNFLGPNNGRNNVFQISFPIICPIILSQKIIPRSDQSNIPMVYKAHWYNIITKETYNLKPPSYEKNVIG